MQELILFVATATVPETGTRGPEPRKGGPRNICTRWTDGGRKEISNIFLEHSTGNPLKNSELYEITKNGAEWTGPKCGMHKFAILE